MILATVLGLSPGAGAARPTTERPITDLDIVRAVKARLLVDEDVNERQVKVESRQGIVRLTGLVATLLVKARAVQIARSIRGVRAVVDELTVRPVRVSDEEIARAATAALAADPATDAHEIDVSVDDGVVTLHGEVDSDPERHLAEEVVQGVEGVRSIHNALVVRPQSVRSDDEIMADIVRRLESDPYVEEQLIGLLVENGRVTLTGTVGTTAEKRRAVRDAWVAGVHAVDDRLDVQWWARDPMRRSAEEPPPSDDQIREAVRDALFYDSRVPSVGTQVDVKGGVVILRGEVPMAEARKAAEEDARHAIGVVEVRNELTVPARSASDLAIEQRVVRRLVDDPYVDRRGIQVYVQDRVVTLSGSVGSRHEKRRAGELARHVPGVRGVVNHLVSPTTWTYAPDLQIRQDLEYALWLHPSIESDRIEVTVRDGVVTLEGEVSTRQEKEAAEEEARKLGALGVQNNLVVQAGS